jgi:N-acetylglutamate synthase-like GNAT family acetyltransferase
MYNLPMPNYLDSEQRFRGASIELADIQDLGSIERINKQLRLDVPDFKWDQKEWISEEIKNSNFFVLRQDGLVCGAICLIPKEKHLTIETIAVDKEKQRIGFGRKLIEFAFKNARKGNMTKVGVGSFIYYGAKDFYLKCGFRLENTAFGCTSYYSFIANV